MNIVLFDVGIKSSAATGPPHCWIELLWEENNLDDKSGVVVFNVSAILIQRNTLGPLVAGHYNLSLSECFSSREGETISLVCVAASKQNV